MEGVYKALAALLRHTQAVTHVAEDHHSLHLHCGQIKGGISAHSKPILSLLHDKNRLVVFKPHG